MALLQGQRQAIKLIQQGHNICITGGAGTGKSYVLQQAVSLLEKAGKKVMVTASTGMAAINVDGVTCHRTFKIPLSFAWKTSPKVRKDTDKALYMADVVFVDEISMIRMDVMDYIVKTLQKVNKETGRKIQLVCFGDFFQLPPVLKNDEYAILNEYYGKDVGGAYAFQAPGWRDYRIEMFELTEIVRQKNSKFAGELNRLRVGDRDCLAYFSQRIQKPPSRCIILAGKNKTAELINENALDKLKGKCKTYEAYITGSINPQDYPTVQFLKVKRGARVVFVKNGDGYVNGQTGVVKVCSDEEIKIDIGEDILNVKKEKWEIEQYVVVEKNGKKVVDKEVVGTFTQFPLKLAYAITIHKSQGQTYMDPVYVKAGEIFAPGQLYVALSRVTELNNLYIDPIAEDCLLAADNVVNFFGKAKKEKTEAPTVLKKEKKKKVLELECETEEFAKKTFEFVKTIDTKVKLEGKKLIFTDPLIKKMAERYINNL